MQHPEESDENTTIFEMQTHAFSVRTPRIVMEKVAKEATEMGRSRDKQLTAILAERYGLK
jgi:Arc-like DNA binding dprotein